MCRRRSASAADGLSAEGRAVEAIGLRRRERVGAHVLVAVVGRRRAVGDEVPAARLHRGHEPGVVAGVDAGRPPPAASISSGQPGRRRLQVAIGPEGRDHAAAEGRVGGERGVRGQVVARVVGGGEHLDVEALEQRPRPEGRLGEARGELRRRARPRSRPTAAARRRRSPRARARASTARACRGRRASARTGAATPRATGLRQRRADAEHLERDAGGVQQPRHVVVGRDQQRRRVAERRVVEQHARVDVAVRRDHGQRRAPRRRAARDRPDAGLGGQQPVGVKHERHRRIVQQCGSAGLDRLLDPEQIRGVRPRAARGRAARRAQRRA